ncbi:MAG: tetratricopeptide repeat protein [Armatimonadia bacterium]
MSRSIRKEAEASMGKWLKRVLVVVLVLEVLCVNTILAALYLQSVGDQAFRDGRTVRALRVYQVTTHLLPFVQRPRVNVARCLVKLGRKNEALAILRDVVNKQRGEAEYRYRLASLALDVGSVPEAVVQCQVGLERRPHSPLLHGVLARALRRLGRSADAANTYQTGAVALGYDDFASNLARALRDSGRAEDAETFEKAAAVMRSKSGPSPSGSGE